jgi:GntR family transcriptional regulator
MMIRHEDDGEQRRRPAYLRIAAQLRAEIVSGRIAPDGRLPSETQLMLRHDVSRSVAKGAIGVLKSDGLVEGRQGAGVFARSHSRIVREPHWPGMCALPSGATEPFEPQPQPGSSEWQADPSTYQSQRIPADTPTGGRLAIEPATPVLRTVTQYLSRSDPPRRALVTSWRPRADEAGDPDPAAWRANQQEERIIVRPASPDEIDALGLPSRGSVLVIARTFTLKGVPVETADVVLPSDQCELVYRLPVE